MFDFITEEHEMIQLAARDFAQKSIAPIAAEHDESGEFPINTVRQMGELGFMGIEVPEEYGGVGMDTLAYSLALTEICKADASHGTIMSVNNSLVRAGSAEVWDRRTKAKVSCAGGKWAENWCLQPNRTAKRQRRGDDAQPGRSK